MEQVARLLSRVWLPRLSPHQPGQSPERFFRWMPRRWLPAGMSGITWISSMFIAAWVASGWFWDRLAPAAVTLPTVSLTDPVVAAHTVAARHLMGEVKGDAGTTDTSRTKTYRLLGLMTASDRWPGFAILAESGKEPMVVVEGEEIVPGQSLLKVLPDHVIIGREGSTESITLN